MKEQFQINGKIKLSCTVTLGQDTEKMPNEFIVEQNILQYLNKERRFHDCHRIWGCLWNSKIDSKCSNFLFLIEYQEGSEFCWKRASYWHASSAIYHSFATLFSCTAQHIKRKQIHLFTSRLVWTAHTPAQESRRAKSPVRFCSPVCPVIYLADLWDVLDSHSCLGSCWAAVLKQQSWDLCRWQKLLGHFQCQ